MAGFSYVAVDKKGIRRKGTMEAKDESRVRILLREKDMIPISVTEQGILTRDITITIGKPVKTRDLSVFCRQFSSILKAGINIVEALLMLRDQAENKVFKAAIAGTMAAVEKGETLADAMRSYKKIYPPILINLVEAGEASGSLDSSFDRMATQFEKSAKIQALVRKAMVYPVMIAVIALAVMIIMSIVVVPQFAAMFAEMGTEMPFTTMMIMSFSNFIIEKYYIIIIVAILFFIALRLFRSTDAGKKVFGWLGIKMPIFGKLAVKNANASFSRTLATLIGAGISITESLEITARSMKNVLYRDAIEDAKTEVEHGVSLAEPIGRNELFTPMVTQMLKIGEETGNIEGMLNKAAEYYEEEVEITTQGLTAAMEPMIMVVLGVIVGFIVLALYQPMISLYSGMENL